MANADLLFTLGGKLDASYQKSIRHAESLAKSVFSKNITASKQQTKVQQQQLKKQRDLEKQQTKKQTRQDNILSREVELTQELKKQNLEYEKQRKLKEQIIAQGPEAYSKKGTFVSPEKAAPSQFTNPEVIKAAMADVANAKTLLNKKVAERTNINENIKAAREEQKTAKNKEAVEAKINALLQERKKIQNDINKATRNLKKATTTEEQLRASTPIKENEAALNRYNKALDAVDKKLVSIAQKMQKINREFTKQSNAYNTAGDEAQDYGNRASDAGEQAASAAEAAKTALQGAATSLITAGFNKIAMSMNKASNALIQLGARAVKTIGRLAGILESTTSKAMSLQKAIRLVVQYGFGFRSLYYLVRRLRSAIKEGFEYLGGIQKSAKKAFSGASEEIHKLVESLRKLMYYLKSAAAAMLAPFAPLINTIIPKLISLFDSLSYAVARFVATLTGSKTIFRATTDLDAYANALDKTSGSAKAAKQSLAAFDDINVLDKGSSGSGSGGAELDTSNWFTEETFEPSTLAELIKAAWEKADFTEVGDYIGQRFSELLSNLNWDDIVTKAGNIGKSLRTFIKGFITVDNLGSDIGEAIAGIFNSIANFIYEYATDDAYWTSLGTFFSDGLKSLFENLDASKYGEAVHNLVAGVMTAISTALENPEESWISDFGEKLGDFLAGLDLKDLASKLLNLAKQIAAGISEALQSWAEQDPDSFGIAKALMLSVVGLKVGSGAFALLGQVLGSTMTGYFAQLGAGAAEAGGVIGKLGTAFSGLFSTLAASPITWIIVGIVALIAALKLLYDNNEGFRKQVDDFFARIKEDVSNIWNNVLKPLWDNLKALFSSIWEGILQPLILAIAERVAPVIMTVLDGIWTAISTVVKFVGQYINDVIVVLKGFIDFVAGVFSGDIDKALQGLQDMFGGLFNGIFHIVQGIVNAVIDAVNWCIRSLNRFLGGIKIPNWDILPAAIRGKSLGDWLNIQEIPHVNLTASVSSANTLNKTRGRGEIAALASGAVIPPNREFLALLGDQTSGTNIEAPLDTIVEAMQIALNNNGSNDREIVLQIDGSELARLTVPNNLRELKRKGYNVKLLGV